MTWNFHLCSPVRASVAQDVARHVLDAGLVVALLGRVADHHHAVDHDRRRRAGDVAELARDTEVRVVGPVPALPGAPVGDQVRQDVDDPGLREAGQRHGVAPVRQRPAGPGVERVEEEGGADDVDDAAAVHLGVGHALAVALAHPAVEAGGCAARGRSRASRRWPDRWRRRYGARRRRCRGCRRRRSGVERETPSAFRPVVVAAPDPRDLEVLEVVRGDLIETRVAGVPGVAADVAPLARPSLAPLGNGGGWNDQETADGAGHHRETEPCPRTLASRVRTLASRVIEPFMGLVLPSEACERGE